MKSPKHLLFFFIFLYSISSQAQCVITLQPDSSGKDTEVFSLSCSSPYAQSTGYCQTSNWGNHNSLRSKVWTWSGTHAALRSLLEFDLSSIPAGCTVSNATLILHSRNQPSQYHCGQNSSIHPCVSNVMQVHRVTQPWAEMTANWINQPTYASTTLGQDYVVVPNNNLPYNDYSINLTAMVNFWLANPTQNNGMMLKQVNETIHYQAVHFASSDNTDPSIRPELVLTLNCPSNCNNTIEGYIYDDKNSDCTMNGTDQPLENWIVEILPGPTYATTDATGYYSANVFDGSYTVNQYVPNSQIWDPLCPIPYTHNVTVSGNSTANASFGVEAEVYCPILNVDIAYSFLRKCHNENFIVNYCNNGNVAAQGVYINVDFSAGLTPLSANITHSVLPSGQWSFPIGTVAPGACASFYITTLVSCTANFGDYECVTAEIFPNDPCSNPIPGDSSTWDKSSVMVTGYCDGDSLACFTITNTGSSSNGNMQGTSEYRIYDNNVLVSVGTFQLTGGANTVICWPVGLGHTIRLEADQRPGHPGNSHPNDVVDNCGTQSRIFNFGASLPEDDAAANIAQECAEIRSSWDPNDKRVIPSGVGLEHNVGQNIMLDYKVRFQNTGNDTAFTIVIRDTLSSALDIRTIQPGSASHDYTFSIENNRVLTFTFNNIMLPDSNVNEALSHGFVKFKVQQIPDVALGTVINNSAAIYFDFNAPVITNNTFLTVADMSQSNVAVKNLVSNTASVKVFPNPFNQTATISVNGYEGNELIVFEVYNTLGESILSIKSTDKEFELNRGQLSAGIYFYRASADKELLGSGKLIVN